MVTHVDNKTQDNNKAVSQLSTNQENANPFQFVDNRSAPLVQRKQQTTDNNSNYLSTDFATQFKSDERAALMPPPFQLKPISNDTMPEALQFKMENAFGQDFSDVKIHQNSSKATQLKARAFTQGTDVHFAPKEYNPSSQQGQELIGHELTHVVQQKQGRVQPTVQTKGIPINDDKGLEQEADEMGKKAASGVKTGLNNKSNATGRGNQIVQQKTWWGIIYNTWSAPMRSSPKIPANEYANIVLDLTKGTEVQIVERVGKSWLKIKFGGKEGYVHNTVIKTIPQPSKPKKQTIPEKGSNKSTSGKSITFEVGKKGGQYVGNSTDIKKVQTLLQKAGYLKPSDIDGLIGPTTFGAIKRFQKDKGIAQTGYISPVDGSLRELEKAVQDLSKKTKDEPNNDEPNVTNIKNVKLDDGPYALQQILQRALGIGSLNTGSGTVKLGVKLGLSANVLKKLATAGIDIEATISGGYSVGDDRRFKIGWSLGFEGVVKSSALWGLLEGEFNKGYTYSESGIYDNIEHWLAIIFSKLSIIAKKLGKKTQDQMGDFLTSKDASRRKRYAYYSNKPAITEKEGEHSTGVKVKAGQVDKNQPNAKISTLGKHRVGGEAGANWKSAKKTYYKKEGGKTYTQEGSSKSKEYFATLIVGKVSLTAKLRVDDIIEDFNPDNEGLYRNYSINISGEFEYDDKVQNKIYEIAKTVIKGTTSGLHLLLKKIATVLKYSVKSTSLESKRFMNQSVTFEWTNVQTDSHKKDEKVFRLQYFRASRTGEYGFKAEQAVPIMSAGVATANVNVGVSASAERSYGVYERMGGNTITYASTVYNGYKMAFQQAKWRNYRKSQATDLTLIALNIGNKGSSAAVEFNSSLPGADNFQKFCVKMYNQSTNNGKSKINTDLLSENEKEKLLGGLEAYLEEVYSITEKKYNDKWKEKK